MRIEEKRRYKRINLKMAVRCFLNLGLSEIRTLSKDISQGGMCIKTKKPLAKGSKVDLVFRLPDKGNISVKAKIVWNNKINPELYDNGLEFIKANQSAIQKIKNYIDSNINGEKHPVSGERRKSKRVPMAIIANYKAFKAHTIDISSTGIRIVTTQSLDKGTESELTLFLYKNTCIIASGVIVWKKEDKTNKQYMYGVEFTRISDTDKEKIEKFIKNTVA